MHRPASVCACKPRRQPGWMKGCTPTISTYRQTNATSKKQLLSPCRRRLPPTPAQSRCWQPHSVQVGLAERHLYLSGLAATPAGFRQRFSPANALRGTDVLALVSESQASAGFQVRFISPAREKTVFNGPCEQCVRALSLILSERKSSNSWYITADVISFLSRSRTRFPRPGKG